ncbi:Protein ACTIVITY OF BC1 COMPLEX KINASE 7 chloroplastic [Bienertia sinuspersici]
MAAILASQGSYCRNMELYQQRIAGDDLGSACSISGTRFPKFEGHSCHLVVYPKGFRFQVEMRQTKAPTDLGSNKRPIKMLPADEVMKSNRTSSVDNAKKINGTKQYINGANKVINGVSIVTRETASSLVKRSRVVEDAGLPPLEEPRMMPSDANFSWANDNYNSVQRSADVWSFVLSLRVRVLLENAKWSYIGGFDEEKQKKRRRRTAAWLRERVLQLGPTFIKLGQLSSTRSDLFPREYVDELAKLQDRVPAFSSKKAREFIAAELGAPVDILFKEFEDQPIAAASLGQVHRAILHNGEKVVVKVQRPGLKRLFDIDLRNLKLIAEYFQRSESLGGPTRDWIGIYEECATILYQEIDYINEGKNADRFRRDFRNVKWVRVPVIHWDYTALKVLTLEYVPGIKINNLDKLDGRGYNRARIASRAIEGYLIQILKTGFFHADPHPGNLAIDKDEAIIYYDFGMMGEIKTFTRERLLDLFYAVYEKDTSKVVRSLIDLGALQPTGDLSTVKRSVQFFLDNLLSQSPDQQQTLAAIGEDLFAIAQDQPFRFPSTFTFVIRAFSTLEGQRLRSIYAIPSPANRRICEATRNRRIEATTRKATILQMATMYTVLGGTLLNLGVTFTSQGTQIAANGSFVGAGVFLTLLIRSMQRVKKLDKFETMI